MLECRHQVRIGAYYDGEMDAVAAAEMAAHLPECLSCQESLAHLRRMTELLSDAPQLQSAPSDGILLTRLHQRLDRSLASGGANDRESQQVLFRFAGWASAVAASLLIISAAWLMETPASTGGGRNIGPVAINDGPPVGTDDWQRLAMTLQSEPINGLDAGPTDTQFADAADWMVSGLQDVSDPAYGGH